MFVTGHAYAEAGMFSTQTTLIDLRTGQKIVNLEDFTVSRNGRVVTAVDVNFWGVTFAPDGDHFYATLATGGKTYLVRGSIHDRTMRTLHENVECPSLSPDGTRIAYKKRVGSGHQPVASHRARPQDHARDALGGGRRARRPGGMAGRSARALRHGTPVLWRRARGRLRSAPGVPRFGQLAGRRPLTKFP